MYTPARFASVAVLLGLTSSLLSAQNVTAAHSGTVHYFEGAVSVDGTPIESQKGRFNTLKDQSVLSTGQGRAEILLTPGVFLRVGENSSIKLLDGRLMSTRVEFLSGTAMIESENPEVSVKDPAVATIIYKDYEIQVNKSGLFELVSSPSQMKVYKGQVEVSAAGNRVVVKEGHLLPFSAALVTEKFDTKTADDLYLWARDRGAYLSAANMASARSVASNPNGFLSFAGLGYSPYGLGGRAGGGSWFYNNALNMYTFLPYGGTYWSPFGYGFFSPFSINEYYNPGSYYWYGGGGSRNGGGTSGQPVNSASQVVRAGIAAARPTLNTPIRGNVNGGASTLRGGFDRSGPGPSFGGFNNAASAGIPSNAGATRGGFSAPSAGPAPMASAPVSAAPSAPASAAPTPRGR